MKGFCKYAAVALSASLLLFGCSSGRNGVAGGVDTSAGSTAGSEVSGSTGAMAEEDFIIEEGMPASEGTYMVKDAIVQSGSQATADNTAENASQETALTAEEIAERENEDFTVSSLALNDSIHINQIGYRTKDFKQVTVNGKSVCYAIVDKASGAKVLEGRMTAGAVDAASGDSLYYADFSALQKPGTYFAAVAGVGITGDFTIGDTVYGSLKNSLLKAFYYQRCGMDLEEKYAGVWAHTACHTEKGSVYGQEEISLDGNGGWHDAGDYGKYTVAAATALADLMMAWEHFPDRFSEKTGIPESANKTPDILEEVKYELNWLLKMQDAKTGGIYHKLTTKTFPPLSMMPQDDMGKLYFSPVSSTATGDFAAITAMASRIFKDSDAALSKTCLTASQKAWKWLTENNGIAGFSNPADITTGEYGDSNDSDERFWAAAELYRTTGAEEYGAYVKSVCSGAGTGGFAFGWQNVGGFAGLAYLNTDKAKQDAAIFDSLKSELLAAADSRLSATGQSGYRITLEPSGFNWGSNMTLLNDARVLILADRYNPAKGYAKAAKGNLDYLLGNNPLNQCYVTGFGTKPVLDPHHRPSKSDAAEQPVPGLVAGGPNAGLQDDFAKMKLKNQPPERCYIDYSGSYSTNEVAIYWNSPAVYVAAYFSGGK